jgi:hypothetical protein
MHHIKSSQIRRGVIPLPESGYDQRKAGCAGIMISMFYLQTSGPQDGSISLRTPIWINRRKYMLEMENITFSDPKQNRMCT